MKKLVFLIKSNKWLIVHTVKNLLQRGYSEIFFTYVAEIRTFQ